MRNRNVLITLLAGVLSILMPHIAAGVPAIEFSPGGSTPGDWSYDGAGTFSFSQDVTVDFVNGGSGDPLVTGGALVYIPDLDVGGIPSGPYTVTPTLASGGTIKITSSDGLTDYMTGTLGSGDLVPIGSTAEAYTDYQADITSITITVAGAALGSSALDAIAAMADPKLDFTISLSGAPAGAFQNMLDNGLTGSNGFSGAMSVIPEAFSGAGSGTEADPYIITDVYQLQEMNDNLDAWYELGNDIDAFATETWNEDPCNPGVYFGFESLGNDPNKFTGHFDGKGHSITGLYINRPGANYVGLFGYVSNENADIRDLILTQASIDGAGPVGALIGCLRSGTVRECGTYAGTVRGSSSVGGLVGVNTGRILNCFASADVEALSGSSGGLVGHNSGFLDVTFPSGKISNCYASGSVTGISHVGGLVGYVYRGGSYISNCYAAAHVTGYDYIGGLVGYDFMSLGHYASCFWDSDVNPSLTGIGNWQDPPNVIGETTENMKIESTFTSANWDFDSIWDIVEGVTYPYLRENNRVIFIEDVPYIHQCYDTPEEFSRSYCKDCPSNNYCGSCACGTASTVMVLAALDRLMLWPNENCIGIVENGTLIGCEGYHTSNYGNYFYKEYTYAGETWGDNPDNEVKAGFKGAFGFINNNPGDPTNYGASGYRIQEFLYKHGIHGENPDDPPEYIRDPDPTIDDVKGELAKKRLLIASTNLGGEGHFVLIRGYDPDSKLFIVNDPFGSKPYGSTCGCGDYDGNCVFYTWDDMCNDGNCLNSTISIAGYKDLDNNSPPEPNNLGQFRPDANTPISFGELITLPTVLFRGSIRDQTEPVEARDSVRLEIELRRLNENFVGKPTHWSDFSPDWSETEVNVPAPDLYPGQYHWRARTVDIRGKESPWVSAGNNGDSEPDFSIGIIMYLCSPADMTITDPDGLTVTKELSQIPGATYEEVDVDGDGETDDKVCIPGRKVGEYLVDVVAEPNASPTDTYSLEAVVEGQTMVLAQDVQIQEIPAEPYLFESKLNRSDFDTDGDVDTVDLGTFALHWLAEECNYPGWCEGTDLNYNGFVDFIDFAVFADNWHWEKNPADIDIGGDVDFVDYAFLASRWRYVDCNEPTWCFGADIDKDGQVDILDLNKFAEHWLEGTAP